MLRTVLDSAAVAVPLTVRNEDLNGLAQSMKGVEALVYPYLNRQLIERLDMARVIGIGAGRIGSSRRDEIDSLIVMDDDRTTAIEVKGPGSKSLLLAGFVDDIHAEFADAETVRGLRTELHDIYNQGSGGFYFDTTIGDILKLANLISAGVIQEGYAVGLLTFTDRTRSQRGAYEELLRKMVDAIARTAGGMRFETAFGQVEGMNVSVSVVGVA